MLLKQRAADVFGLCLLWHIRNCPEARWRTRPPGEGAKPLKGDPAMGDLIRMPHSELHATIELLDSLGVTPKDFEELRKASSWRQRMTARVFKNDLTIFAALEFGDAATRLGFKPGELRALASRGDLLQLVQNALLGDAATQHLINCDARPFEPSGLTVAPESDQLSGRVRGQFVFDPAKIKLHLSLNQQDGEYLKGDKIG